MGIMVGNHVFSTEISLSVIADIARNTTPPSMSLWEIIKDFFCFTRRAEALECLYQLCHPGYNRDGMVSTGTHNNTDKIFNQLKELAAPGYQDRFSQSESSDNTQQQFIIKDENGEFILHIIRLTNQYLIDILGSPQKTIRLQPATERAWDRGFDRITLLNWSYRPFDPP
ncbi:Secreted effector protein sseI [Yersinia thracica]|uniref:Secreted effector protein sseI n=1 Tax=Yersinia thracica TaxID=2890319 RepID=A0A0T9PIQ2_9GAMM|nr:hypothetical protein [Yersinia thracica]CNH66526.1 Secreted effector protein sseI [Yersinia thracica]